MQRCVTLNVHIVDMKDCGKKILQFQCREGDNSNNTVAF